MASISQLKTKLQNALNSKLSIGEQSLTEDQKKKTLGNLGIWDKLVDYGNKIENILNSIAGINTTLSSHTTTIGNHTTSINSLNSTTSSHTSSISSINSTLNNKLNLSGGTMSGNIILPGNKSIVQHQRYDSNYTECSKWLRGGVSQNTYDPQIGQHNIGGDGTGSICILPYATSSNPWEQNVGLFVYKGGLKIDGKYIPNITEHKILAEDQKTTKATGSIGAFVCASVDITAPSKSGYRFVCRIIKGVNNTSGKIHIYYVENNTAVSTRVWYYHAYSSTASYNADFMFTNIYERIS